MSDLTAFLAARLGEDEAGGYPDVHERSCATAGPISFPCDCAYPARVLREVEAKRKILAEHRLDDMVPGVCYRCRYGVPAHWESTPYPCPTLRALAAVYAGHPDYDPAWT
jgi:Family of unknown function (DUF6221)